MPEHQEITHFAPAILRCLNQSFDLARCEVFAMAGVSLAPAAFHVFSPFRPFMFWRELA
jgi:hypothetical protein